MANLFPLVFLDFIFFGKLEKEFWQELEESSAYFFFKCLKDISTSGVTPADLLAASLTIMLSL